MRKVFLGLWLLGVVAILCLVGGGEDDFAGRAAVLAQVATRSQPVTATVTRQLKLPVVRLTRRGPRTEQLDHSELTYRLNDRDCTSQALGTWPVGSQLQVFVDPQDPLVGYPAPPAQMLHDLKVNHYGTLLTIKIFVLSMFSFFLGIIYKSRTES